MNHSRHIDKLVEKQSSQEIEKNWLQLKTSMDSVQCLAFQACAFRSHDESSKSKNQDNFIELVKLLATYNDDVVDIVFRKCFKKCQIYITQNSKGNSAYHCKESAGCNSQRNWGCQILHSRWWSLGWVKNGANDYYFKVCEQRWLH